MEPRASSLLGKHSTNELHPQSFYFFETECHYFAQIGLQFLGSSNPLATAFQVARTKVCITMPSLQSFWSLTFIRQPPKHI